MRIETWDLEHREIQPGSMCLTKIHRNWGFPFPSIPLYSIQQTFVKHCPMGDTKGAVGVTILKFTSCGWYLTGQVLGSNTAFITGTKGHPRYFYCIFCSMEMFEVCCLFPTWTQQVFWVGRIGNLTAWGPQCNMLWEWAKKHKYLKKPVADSIYGKSASWSWLPLTLRCDFWASHLRSQLCHL